MDYKRLSKAEVVAHARANARGDRRRFSGPKWEFMRVVWNYHDAFEPGDVTIARESVEEPDSWVAYSPRAGEEVLVHGDAIRHSSKANGP